MTQPVCREDVALPWCNAGKADLSAAARGSLNVAGNKWRCWSASDNELIAALNMDTQLRLVRTEAPDD